MSDEVVVASAEDLQVARDNALRRCGLSYEELKAQHDRGWYDSIDGRLAWMAVSGVDEELGGQDD